MSAIAITRMVGSGAEEIARLLAEVLNAVYLDREIIARAAHLAAAPEDVIVEAVRVPSFFERIAEVLGKYPSLDVIGMPGSALEPPSVPLASYRQRVEEVIRNAAQTETAVIVGHGAPVLLRDQPGVLRVFIHGSKTRRLERLLAEEKMSRPAAEQYLQKLDREWRDYMQRYYKVDWRTLELYDLVLNTDLLTTQSAAQIVLSAFHILLSPHAA